MDVILSDNPPSVSLKDIDFICDRNFPFIQIINSNATFEEGQSIELITIATQDGTTWTIHDYGDAISVSVVCNEKESNKKYRKITPGEQEKVIEEIVNIFTKKGWASVELIDGTSLMRFLMRFFQWVKSQHNSGGFTLNGCPSESPENDERRFNILFKHAKDMGITCEYAFTPGEDTASGSVGGVE